jgi:hypothetical protein
MREGYAVHAPCGDLDDSDGGGGEEGVEAGAGDGGGFVAVEGGGAETELAGFAVAEDVDVEFGCWGGVEGGGFESFGGLGRGAGEGTLFVWWAVWDFGLRDRAFWSCGGISIRVEYLVYKMHCEYWYIPESASFSAGSFGGGSLLVDFVLAISDIRPGRDVMMGAIIDDSQTVSQ